MLWDCFEQTAKTSISVKVYCNRNFAGGWVSAILSKLKNNILFHNVKIQSRTI